MVLHLNELRGKAHVVSAFAKAVFQNIFHGKVASNLVEAFVFVFVSHDGRSRDHTQLFWIKPP